MPPIHEKDARGLTERQGIAYDLLSEGKSVAEVAKSMKIGVPGVYGHIRKIRAAGLVIPEGNGSTPEPEGTGNGEVTNGKVERSASVKAALDTINSSLDDETKGAEEIATRAKALAEELTVAEGHVREAKVRIDALVQSREALETATV